jgi:adenosylcobinamide-GDP ribazoletransferase
VALRDELAAAVGDLTLCGRLAADVPRPARAAALAFYPAIGLLLGGLAAGAAAALGQRLPRAAGPAGVAVLLLASRAGGSRALAAAIGGWPGACVALLVIAARFAAACVLPVAALPGALLLAPTLGAWAVVVQCYGGAPAPGDARAAAVVGRARFREFGAASVVALGVALALGQAVGLVVVVAAALVTVGTRAAAYRRRRGLAAPLLGASRELVETTVLVVLGLLAPLAA